MEGLINGILMLALVGISNHIHLTARQAKTFYLSIIVTGYGNALYGWARGLSGENGMDGSTSMGSILVQLLGGVPVIAAFLMVALMIIGARAAHR